MKISDKGLALVKSFEGCLRKTGDGTYGPYICPAGVLTIGWGHTNAHGRRFDRSARWTKAECDAALAEDMAGFERDVARLVKVRLNQGQFDALVSFAYNCGAGALAKSTLLRRLNAGDTDGAADEFGKWVKGGGRVLPGLVRRRAAEAQLFRSKPPIVPARHEPMPQQVDPPEDDDIPQRQPDDPGPEPARPTKPAVQSTEIWSQLVAIISAIASYVTDVRLLALVVVLFCAYQIWKRYERGDLRGLFK